MDGLPNHPVHGHLVNPENGKREALNPRDFREKRFILLTKRGGDIFPVGYDDRNVSPPTAPHAPRSRLAESAHLWAIGRGAGRRAVAAMAGSALDALGGARRLHRGRRHGFLRRLSGAHLEAAVAARGKCSTPSPTSCSSRRRCSPSPPIRRWSAGRSGRRSSSCAARFLVSGLREYLAELKVPLPVSAIAKWKTTVQMVALGFFIAGPAGEVVLPGTVKIGGDCSGSRRC